MIDIKIYVYIHIYIYNIDELDDWLINTMNFSVACKYIGLVIILAILKQFACFLYTIFIWQLALWELIFSPKLSVLLDNLIFHFVVASS